MMNRNKVGACICFALSITFIAQYVLSGNLQSEIQATIWSAVGTLLLFGIDR